MKVLHVINDFPYPPNHGGIADIWGRLLSFVELGMEVHAIVTIKIRPSETDIDHVRKHVSHLDMIERQPNWKGIFSRTPIQVVSRNNLSIFPIKDHYDLVIGESDFSFPIFENTSLSTDRRILRIHNDESRYMLNLSDIETKFWKRIYYKTEAMRCSNFSYKAFSSVDDLWFSSSDQYADYIRSHSVDAPKAAWLPPPVDIDAMVSPRIKASKHVLFVGSLSVPSNIEAIDWYMKGVHPKLKAIAGYRFVIAGSTRGLPLSKTIRNASMDEQCDLHLDVQYLNPLYEMSSVFVNCMLHGASIKMKTVHAVEKGLPVVSTSVGNEGTGFTDQQHICIADNQDKFAQSISRLLAFPSEGQAMAMRAQAYLKTRYRHSEQIHQLLHSKKLASLL